MLLASSAEAEHFSDTGCNCFSLSRTGSALSSASIGSPRMPTQGRSPMAGSVLVTRYAVP